MQTDHYNNVFVYTITEKSQQIWQQNRLAILTVTTSPADSSQSMIRVEPNLQDWRSIFTTLHMQNMIAMFVELSCSMQ